MASTVQVRVPDIGDFDQVDVVEVLVKVGDQVKVDDSLITLESEKASMEVPSTHAGMVEEILVQVGDKVGEGAVIVRLRRPDAAPRTTGRAARAAASETAEAKPPAGGEREEDPPSIELPLPAPERGPSPATGEGEIRLEAAEIKTAEEPAAALDGAPASVARAAPDAEAAPEPVPEPARAAAAEAIEKPEQPQQPEPPVDETPKPKAADAPRAELEEDREPPPAPLAAPPPPLVGQPERAGQLVHASPSVRRFARELGVDLPRVEGSGPKQRILKADVSAFVKRQLQGGAGQARETGAAAAGVLPALPVIDFSKFGAVEHRPLSRIRKLAASNVHRSWLHVPHVTQFDQADVTDLEVFREERKAEAQRRGARLTPLPFVMKACIAALRQFPEVNSSLDPSGEGLILKRYYHLGIAVDTEDGLVVPVVRDVDQKGIVDLAVELAAVSERARARKLRPNDIQGASFTISSLGSLGGTAFTPIVNAPEVAILGVARMSWQPVYREGQFVPRRMLPLCLSYDHRVVDGAMGVRFLRAVAEALEDIRRVLL